MLSGLLAPLFGWFFELVGQEARAEIQRKKAVKAKKARDKKKKEKMAAQRKAQRNKLMEQIHKEVIADNERREKGRRVRAELQKQIDGLCDSVAPPAPWASER